MTIFNVGIIGLGTVGGGVYRQLKKKAALIQRKTGIRVKVTAVCDTNKKVLKALGVSQNEIVASYQDILNDASIHCIVELVGGVGIAKKIVLDAFKKGKDVITANKALLAEEGDEIFSAARASGRQIFFEASVAGGIPIIKGVKEALVSNNVSTILGIINGTCNYILSRMTGEGMGFREALQLAKEKGYAEANPALDIDGIDAAHKIALLAQLAFQKNIPFAAVSTEGISEITAGDISFAEQLGYVVKLLAIAKKTRAGIEVRVQPTLLPKDHILANVNDSYNAVYLMCDDVENLLFYGRGAGEKPTASAVVSDVVDLARTSFGERMALPMVELPTVQVKNMSSILSRYYLRFSAIDKPGVLAKISSILGRYGVSISDVIQQERKHGHAVPLVLLTHETHEKSIRQSVHDIQKLAVVQSNPQVLRIEE